MALFSSHNFLSPRVILSIFKAEASQILTCHPALDCFPDISIRRTCGLLRPNVFLKNSLLFPLQTHAPLRCMAPLPSETSKLKLWNSCHLPFPHTLCLVTLPPIYYLYPSIYYSVFSSGLTPCNLLPEQVQ